nr:ATP-binding protein [Novosphingobium jiangmenense]
MRWLSHPTPNLGEARSALNRAAEQVSRITCVVNPVQALTQVSPSGKSRCDVVKTIRSLLPLLQGQLSEHEIEISLFDSTRPDTSEVALHCTEVSQILLNLITNSIDAVSQNIGQRLILIRLSRCANTMLRIEVEDNGPGIVLADIPAVFEPFYSTKSSGTGLGLPITSAIVERCKGSIELESEQGKGTLITVLLPLLEAGC